MKGYYVFGLQRSGTNFLEQLMKKNFGAQRRNSAKDSWKHSIDIPTGYERGAPTLIIHKNPYTWVESIALRNTVDWLKTQNTYPAKEIEDDRYVIGSSPPMNIINLAKTYKHFHETWLKDEYLVISYENLLIEEKRNEALRSIQERYDFSRPKNKPWEIPQRGSVSQSRDYNTQREEYYIQGKPETLNHLQIAKINFILGKDLISSMGYEVL